jgi:hypothetical protein
MQPDFRAENRKFALRFIATLVIGAACCAALVGLVIYLTSE